MSMKLGALLKGEVSNKCDCSEKGGRGRFAVRRNLQWFKGS